MPITAAAKPLGQTGGIKDHPLKTPSATPPTTTLTRSLSVYQVRSILAEVAFSIDLFLINFGFINARPPMQPQC